MPCPHFFSLRPSIFDLHQRTFIDPRAVVRQFPPLPAAFHHLRPEGKNPALHRLDGMNRAAARNQKYALRVPRNPQPNPVFGAVTVAPLKCRRAQCQMRRDAHHVRLAQVYKAALLAACGTPGLTLESKSRRHRTIISPNRLPGMKSGQNIREACSQGQNVNLRPVKTAHSMIYFGPS